MKGVHGLVIAVVLGLLGGALNFVYIQNKTSESDTVMFVGIRAEAKIEAGQRFKKSDFVQVPIPRKHAETLRDFAFTYDSVDGLTGMQPRRAYQGGELVLRTDMQTPPTEPKFDQGANETVISVGQGKDFETALVKPGDMIEFVFSNNPDRFSSTESDGGGENDPALEIIGDFRVVSVGPQLSSVPVRGSHGGKTIGIIVKKEGNQFDALATRLLTRIDQGKPYRISLVSTSKRLE